MINAMVGGKMEGTDEKKLSALPPLMQALIGKSKDDVKAFLTEPDVNMEQLDQIVAGMSA